MPNLHLGFFFVILCKFIQYILIMFTHLLHCLPGLPPPNSLCIEHCILSLKTIKSNLCCSKILGCGASLDLVDQSVITCLKTTSSFQLLSKADSSLGLQACTSNHCSILPLCVNASFIFIPSTVKDRRNCRCLQTIRYTIISMSAILAILYCYISYYATNETTRKSN